MTHDIVIESIHPILPRIWYPDSSIFNQFGRSEVIEDEYRKLKDGLEDGIWTFWTEDGQKKEEGTYKEGKKVF